MKGLGLVVGGLGGLGELVDVGIALDLLGLR
jgi:hypothetical protein